MGPEISVVMPVYNGQKYLADAIKSVRAQSVDWELIVVDDGSTDSSRDVADHVAASDPRIRVVSQANAGVAHARNAGFAASTPVSEFVVFTDQDDYWEPDALLVLREDLRSNLNMPAAYGLARQIDGEGRPLTLRVEDALGFERYGIREGQSRRLDPADPTTLDAMVAWPCFCTPGQMLIRRTALESAGLFDPACAGGDEWELAMRLSLIGPLSFLPRFVINKREHGENAFMIPGYVRRSGIAIRTKLARDSVYADQRALMRRGHREAIRMHVGWMRDALRNGKPQQAARLAYRIAKDVALYIRLGVSPSS